MVDDALVGGLRGRAHTSKKGHERVFREKRSAQGDCSVRSSASSVLMSVFVLTRPISCRDDREHVWQFALVIAATALLEPRQSRHHQADP